MPAICSDLIIIPEKNNAWVIINTFSRESLGVESSSLEVLQDAQKLSEAKIKEKYRSNKFAVWQIETFSNYAGLLADPTRYIRDTVKWKAQVITDVQELISVFVKKSFLIEDEKKYRDRFSQKKSLIDTNNFGNFHEQLGQYLMLEKREDPEKWWTDQKFTKNYKAIRNNLYQAVQENFLIPYFKRKFSKKTSVLDIGCGVGYYSNKIAETGASVLAIDPNEKYIKIAKNSATAENIEFKVMNIGFSKALDAIPSESVDYVYISDALLFYFVSFKNAVKPDLGILLKDIHRILKKNGSFISVEPHYTFWLAPWLGSAQKPYTVLTEYRSQSFYVTPSPGKFMQAILNHKFSITWMEEIYPNPFFEKTDKRAYNFAAEFPLWQLYEFRKS